MNWIVADLLMFACSVIVYLTIRKAGLNGMSTQFNNLAWFGTELVGFGIAAAIVRPAFGFTPVNVLLLFFAGIVLSYLSSIMSMKSIALAPNPGYSLVLSKSYVILTSLVAVPLFGARLPAQALVAILLIVGFSTLIMINPKKTHHAKSNTWALLALGSFFGWGLLSLVAKYLFTHGMAPLAFLSSLSVIVTICIFIEMRVKHIALQPIRKHPFSFLAIGVSAMGFNFFNFTAISIAPNVGFVNATNAASIAAVTIFSILLFKDEFSWRKLVGVVGVILGLFALFLT